MHLKSACILILAIQVLSSHAFVLSGPGGNRCHIDGEDHTIGEKFYIGCTAVCKCESGTSVSCISRCPPVFPPPDAQNCRWVPSPSDECCDIPECDPPVVQNVTTPVTPIIGENVIDDTRE